jgi:hypothetical protein
MATFSSAQVFISYSHKDKKYLEEFREHLVHLERTLLVNYWSDDKIRPGQKWKKEIEQAIMSAKVAVLFISHHFLASSFISDHELPSLLAKSGAEGTLLFSIIVWPSRYDAHKALSELQAINDPRRPLSKMRPAEREELYVAATKEIETALNHKSNSLSKRNTDNTIQSTYATSEQSLYKPDLAGTTYLTNNNRHGMGVNDLFRMLILRKRLQKYGILWQITEALPKWPKPVDVTYKKLEELSVSLRDWYFKHQGGLYLTRESHTAYSALQDHLSELSGKRVGRLSSEHYDLIRSYCSKLRTQLAEDLQTRRRPA